MRWTLHKVDSFVGTIIAAVAGLLASQVIAFMNAYLQRLGGHIDEARLSLVSKQMASAINDEIVRGQFTAVMRARIDVLENAQRAIEQASVFKRPFVFLWHVDHDIALGTAQAFHPALPIDVQSLIFAGTGIVLGWLVWELLKLPLLFFRRNVTTEPPAWP
jgi:hypothetical protein